MFSNSPVTTVFFVHFKNNPVTAIIRNVDVYRGIGSARKEPEIEFTESVSCLDQFGEVNVSNKTEVHSTLVCWLTSKHRAGIA